VSGVTQKRKKYQLLNVDGPAGPVVVVGQESHHIFVVVVAACCCHFLSGGNEFQNQIKPTHVIRL
jgi:hypothetical protein